MWRGVLGSFSTTRRITRHCTLLALLSSSSSLSSAFLVVAGQTPPQQHSLSSSSSLTQCSATNSAGTSIRNYHSNTSNQDMSGDSSTLEVAQFPCLNDNYGYLLHDPTTGETAAVDTPESGPIQAELQRRGWTLTHIFNTHHHYDHVGGNEALSKAALSSGGQALEIAGPASEKIPGRTQALSGGDELTFGNGHRVQIIDVGGHTLGHIAYYFPNTHQLFCGDALFTLGCGRMFEGTPDQFWASLQRLRDLPDETTVYCAHEYTAANAKFALSVEPGNAVLQEQVQRITEKRAAGQPTVPSTIGAEKAANPFLRCDVSAELRQAVGVTNTDTPAQAFAKVRKAKDHFRG